MWCTEEHEQLRRIEDVPIILFVVLLLAHEQSFGDNDASQTMSNEKQGSFLILSDD